MKITTAGDLFTLGARGWVFFSRASHSFSRTALDCSRTLSNCRKERRRKEKQTNNQPTTKTKKKKNVCGQVPMAILAIFSSFFFLLEGKSPLYRFRANRKAITKTQRRSPLHILWEAKDIFREHRVFRRIFSHNCFLLYFFCFLLYSCW